MNKTDIKTLTIDELRAKFDKKKIDFNPSYQRKSGVWREGKKLLLIDSILNGYIFPVVYFRRKSNDPDEWEVVDGSQRLTAIKEYLIENKVFCFEKYGIDAYKHYDGKTWSELIDMPLMDMCKLSHKKGEDLQRLKEFKLEYVLITSATDDEMTDVFRRLNSGEPLSEGEWLTCLLPSLPLWEITKAFADHCYTNHRGIIYNHKKNGDIHEDFDTLRNMDAWFWANIALVLYQYEKNGSLKFINGKRAVVCDRYEELQAEYSKMNKAEQEQEIALCDRIKSNMVKALDLFLAICKLMQNEFKRPKALFAAFIFSYMYRDNSALINNLLQRENTFSKRIRLFSGETINRRGNEAVIDFTTTISNDYKKNTNNTPCARENRYSCYVKLLINE